MFLYGHQDKKIILFCANCELVNFLEALFRKIDWAMVGRRVETNEARER